MQLEEPMVNREYLLSLVQTLNPDLLNYFNSIIPTVQILSINEMNRIMLSELIRFKNSDQTRSVRALCTESTCGKKWFNIFTTVFLPFINQNKEFFLNGK